jgi:transcriptional regulator with XRE-family HTH domain
MEIMEHLEKLRAIRLEKRITQTDMAVKLGISRSMLWRYETGRIDMTFGLFVKYAGCLGFKVQVVL